MLKFFGTDIWNSIIFYLDEKWTDYSNQHGSIGFDLENEDFQYSFDIYGTSRWEKGGYVLFVGNDGCGNTDMYVFKLANKVEE